ncbi:MAG: metal ABC transporter permease [SAR324 cluster bacterium]|nr:metal ABC transporter permease [SAR324 cluster bacterium]
MINLLLEPFTYLYMQKAIAICAVVGGLCAFLSSYLMLKGWSLMGDALAHAVVPGVALSHIFKVPYVVGAFFPGMLAVGGMAFLKQKTKLSEDATIGLVFTAFLASGLLLISLNPVEVDLATIVLGNILAISEYDIWQMLSISAICFMVLALKWKDFMIIFFDETHARSIGLPVTLLQIIFFTILSLSIVAALQTVGAFLVIAMVITPGATAYLLTDRFSNLIFISIGLGVFTGGFGVYLSYFLDIHSGGLVVVLQTTIFLSAFLFAPKHGFIKTRLISVKV